jgi:hypothetical protein
MAASKKKRSKPAARSKAKKTAVSQADLKALDSEWRSFIDTAARDAPLAEAWTDPEGAPSPRTVIRSAAAKKALKTTAKKKAAKKKAKKTGAAKK